MFKSVNRFTGKLRSRSLQRQMMMLFTIMLVIPILLVSYFSKRIGITSIMVKSIII